MFPIRSLNTKLELELTWHFFPCLRLAAGGGDGLMLQLGMSHCLRSWREGGNDDFLIDNHNSQHDYRLSWVGMSFLSTWGLDEAEGCPLWLTWTNTLLTSGWGADGKMANDLAYTSKVTSERVPIFFCVCHWHVGQTEAFDRLWEMLRCPCSGDAGNTKHSSQLLQLNREILHPQRSTMCGEGRQTKCMLTGVLPVSMWLIVLHKIGTHLGPPVLAFNWAGTLIQHKLLWGFQFPWIKASAVSLFQSSGRFPSTVICDVLFVYPYDSVFCVLLICCGEKGNVWAMWSSWAGLAAGLVWLRYRGISRAARWQLGDLCAPPCWWAGLQGLGACCWHPAVVRIVWFSLLCFAWSER